MLTDILKDDLQRLLEVTKGCRPDMHEPDEQELRCFVVGDHLDNAFGTEVTVDKGYQEFLVVLRRPGDLEARVFNLANLIALARTASDSTNPKLVDPESDQTIRSGAPLFDQRFEAWLEARRTPEGQRDALRAAFRAGRSVSQDELLLRVYKIAVPLLRLSIGDYVYSVRDRVDPDTLEPNQSTWDHPDVKAWSDASVELSKLAEYAEGQLGLPAWENEA